MHSGWCLFTENEEHCGEREIGRGLEARRSLLDLKFEILVKYVNGDVK